ncbi:hypothetical protein ACS0TY_011664 [Phlomoides rotata]
MVHIGRFKLREGGTNFWKWRHSPNGQGSVNSAYGLLQIRKKPEEEVLPEKKLYRKLWRSWATRKAVITAWKLIKENMATTDNLIRKGITLDEKARICQLCKDRDENI